MKRSQSRMLLVACVLFLICPGCLVRSVHPWLQKSSIGFEEDLLGGWVGVAADGSNVAMTFVRGEGNDYVIQYSSKDGQGTFVGHVGKFGADYVLDFRPKEGAPGVDGLLLLPTHSVARLELGREKLALRQLDYGAVKSAGKLDRLRDVKYAWTDDDELVMTSNSEELQRFILSLDRNSELFAQPIRLNRSK